MEDENFNEEMPELELKRVEYKKIDDNLTEVYLRDWQDKNKKRLIFKINKATKIVEFFPEKADLLKTIIFEGFDKIPTDEVADGGYLKAGLGYYVVNRLEKKSIKNLVISKINKSSIRKNKVVLAYDNFKLLVKHFKQINNQSKKDRSNTIDDFLSKNFPNEFTSAQETSKSRSKKAISLLDESIIDHVDKNDFSLVLKFVEKYLSKKGKQNSEKQKIFSTTKLKVDEITLKKIIEEFKSLLSKKSSEDKWSKFLKKNLFLFDSKYIKLIPQLNVVLAKSRKVDFGLIDTSGYLDLFEIKKSNTDLLSKESDRGNYYWSQSMTKAITQIEKYLYNAEIKSRDLKADIEREYGDMVAEVVKPRGFLIVGSSKQFSNANMKEDFRVLRRSLKNVEIVLYDELLLQMENVKNKIYTE